MSGSARAQLHAHACIHAQTQLGMHARVCAKKGPRTLLYSRASIRTDTHSARASVLPTRLASRTRLQRRAGSPISSTECASTCVPAGAHASGHGLSACLVIALFGRRDMRRHTRHRASAAARGVRRRSLPRVRMHATTANAPRRSAVSTSAPTRRSQRRSAQIRQTCTTCKTRPPQPPQPPPRPPPHPRHQTRRPTCVCRVLSARAQSLSARTSRTGCRLATRRAQSASSCQSDSDPHRESLPRTHALCAARTRERALRACSSAAEVALELASLCTAPLCSCQRLLAQFLATRWRVRSLESACASLGPNTRHDLSRPPKTSTSC